MPGIIEHSWNGTILTITSDSGTSSCDLKGPTGDIGTRGPQGEPGIVYGEDGTVISSGLVALDERVASLETAYSKLLDVSEVAL